MNVITVVRLFVPSKPPFNSGSSGRILRIRIAHPDKPWKGFAQPLNSGTVLERKMKLWERPWRAFYFLSRKCPPDRSGWHAGRDFRTVKGQVCFGVQEQAISWIPMAEEHSWPGDEGAMLRHYP